MKDEVKKGSLFDAVISAAKSGAEESQSAARAYAAFVAAVDAGDYSLAANRMWQAATAAGYAQAYLEIAASAARAEGDKTILRLYTTRALAARCAAEAYRGGLDALVAAGFRA